MSSSDESSEDETQILPHSIAVDKTKMAAAVANQVMIKLIGSATPGIKIINLCKAGDAAIRENLKTCYRKNKTKRISPSTAVPGLACPVM